MLRRVLQGDRRSRATSTPTSRRCPRTTRRRRRRRRPERGADRAVPPPRPTARGSGSSRSRLETIERRARRLAAHSNVATVDLAGGACPGPEAVRAAFDRDEVLAASDVLCLLKRAVDVLAAEPNVLGLQAPLLTIGDIHGQYGDLKSSCHGDGGDGALLAGAARLRRAGSARGRPRASGDKKVGSLLFLGDYVDRGARSCEVLFYLLALKVRLPAEGAPAPREPRVAELHGPLRLPRRVQPQVRPARLQPVLRVFEAMPLAAVADRRARRHLLLPRRIRAGFAARRGPERHRPPRRARR